MSQLLDTLIGMDPVGGGALLLCAIMAALLGVVIVVGFSLVRPSTRSSRKGGASAAPDLGLLALWHLNRALAKSAHRRPGDSRPVEPVRPTP